MRPWYCLSYVFVLLFYLSPLSAQISLIGTATPAGDFLTDYDMDQNPGNPAEWTLTLSLQPGEVKFRANGDWAINWGAADFPSGIGFQNGPNIPVSTGGYYFVAIDTSTGAYSFSLQPGGPAPSVGIGTNTPDPSAVLDIESGNQGMLIPRMSTTARNAIPGPAEGLMVFDSTTNSFWVFEQGWQEIVHRAGTPGAAADDLLVYDGTHWVAKNAVTGSAGSGLAQNNMQPYLAVNFIIALNGTYPLRSGSDPFIGEIIMFAGNFAPRDWAFCNGQLLPVNQNQSLFSLLGTTYGGDGRTTFALPDLRGRVPLHSGQGPGLSSRPLGQNGGSETNTMAITQMPAHTHTIIYQN